LRDLTNLNVPPVKPKKVRSSLRRGLTLSWFVSAIRTWQLKRINRDVERTLERVTRATLQKTSSVPVTGPVKRGEDEMRVEEVLAKLEKHEAECNLRYQRIEEKLSETKKTLDGLDLKIWGLGILIIVTPIIHKFLG
jgi:hypothetical protein